MSQEAASKILFNFAEQPTVALNRRSAELEMSIATGVHGEPRLGELTREANHVGFELIYRREEHLAPAALAVVLERELVAERQLVTV